MAQEGVLHAHVGQVPQRGELVSQGVVGAAPEADAGGASVEDHVAREGQAALGQPQGGLPRHVAGHRHRHELPAAAAHHVAGGQRPAGHLVALEVRDVGPDGVGHLLGLGGADALPHQALRHVVAVRRRGEAPHVGKRGAGERHPHAGLRELARLAGVVDVRVRAEERGVGGVHPQAHEGAHEAGVVVVIGGAGVHDERLCPVAHHEDVDGGQEGLAHEQLDAPDLRLVEDARAGKAVGVQRERPGVAHDARDALLAGLRGRGGGLCPLAGRASQRAPSRRSS